MPRLFKNFREKLTEALTRHLWRQRSMLGVASFWEPQKTWLIDPEALWLATTYLKEKETRLYGVSETWILKHRDLWMRSRYKKLVKHYQETQDKLSASRNYTPLPAVEPRRSWGKIQGRAKKVLRPIAPRDSSMVRFKLRGIFGREARAEVFLYFLYHLEGTSSSIAKEFFGKAKGQKDGLCNARTRKKNMAKGVRYRVVAAVSQLGEGLHRTLSGCRNPAIGAVERRCIFAFLFLQGCVSVVRRTLGEIAPFSARPDSLSRRNFSPGF